MDFDSPADAKKQYEEFNGKLEIKGNPIDLLLVRTFEERGT